MISQILIIALLVDAVHYTLQHGEILGFIGDWLDTWVPDKLQQPVYDCNVCMTPWYGSLFFGLIWGGPVKVWIIVVIAAMGLNAVLNRLSAKDE
jgi:hypothetical protein